VSAWAKPVVGNDVLCVPLTDRGDEVFAVVEFNGDALTGISERAFRDFARPLGLAVQVCTALEHYA
jgi:hypothetical protein